MAQKPSGSAIIPPPLRRGWTLGVSSMLHPGTGYAPGDLAQITGYGAVTTAEFGVSSVISPAGEVDQWIEIRKGFYKQRPANLISTVRETGVGTGWDLVCIWLATGAVTAGIVKLLLAGDGFVVDDEVTFGSDTFGTPLTIAVTRIHHGQNSPPGKGLIREYVIVDAGLQTKTPPKVLPQTTTTGTGVGSLVQVTWVPADQP